MSKNNDYTIGHLLNYEYFKDHYRVIAIDLSKQIELENLDLKQQINFTGRLEENNATIFFIIEKIEETTFDFSQNSVILFDMYKNGNSKDCKKNLQQKNGTLLMIKIMNNMAEEIKMIQTLNLRQKLLNQIFVINQMHIFLSQEI